MTANQSKLRIIPLGGMNEIGKNMTVFEYGEDALVVDCGFAFPDDEMLGVDYVIPDISYLLRIRDKIKGIVLTHGHEDHIGGIPYVLKQIPLPIYGTRLTLGILFNKLREHGLEKTAKLTEVSAGGSIKLGSFDVEFIGVNHSIADAAALAIHTRVGTVIHTGDFKIDTTPILGETIDLTRFGELGKRGVLALLADSTNVERPGYSMSERKVGDSFDNIFRVSDNKRIIVTTFASNVHRVQQIINYAVKYNRKVAVTGRSMINILNAARQLGYMSIPDGTLIDIDLITRYPHEKIVIITTGSQGEHMSALYRMAFSDHKKVEVGPQDLVVMSASPIPGNEKLVTKVINELFKAGAEVVHDSFAEVHVSGHACQEEIKLIHALTRPKYFIPVHGEYRHLKKHAALAQSMGLDSRNIFVLDIGDVLEMDRYKASVIGTVPSGKVLVDGLGVGDVGNVVLRDRKHLAQDGLIVVVATVDSSSGVMLSGPDIVSRGFVYVREAEDLMESARTLARDVLLENEKTHVSDWAFVKSKVREALSAYLYEKTKRSPMILPVIMEV